MLHEIWGKRTFLAGLYPFGASLYPLGCFQLQVTENSTNNNLSLTHHCKAIILQ